MVYDPAHNSACKITVDVKATNKKSKFTCKKGRCIHNCWVCTFHNLDNKELLDEIRNTMKAKGLTMGFHVRVNVGGVREETGRESFSSSGSLQLTPEAPVIAAHSDCNNPEAQNQVEELYRAI